MDLVLRLEDNRIWKPGSRKIMNFKRLPIEAREELLKYFTAFMAMEYAEQLYRAIETQRFKRLWADLTPKYLKHKELMGWSTQIWEATGLLKNSIGFWRLHRAGVHYAVGIRSNAFYTTETGEKLSVRKVAQWMEYGTGEKAEDGKGKPGFPGMPARPLFRPMRDQMSKNIDFYFKKFLGDYHEEVDSVLASISMGYKTSSDATRRIV